MVKGATNGSEFDELIDCLKSLTEKEFIEVLYKSFPDRGSKEFHKGFGTIETHLALVEVYNTIDDLKDHKRSLDGENVPEVIFLAQHADDIEYPKIGYSGLSQSNSLLDDSGNCSCGATIRSYTKHMICPACRRYDYKF